MTSTNRLPLSAIRVIALEQAVAAPLCTRHLADLGADVIKIERPGDGDFARDYDSTVGGLSSWFVWLNRGKRSVTVDLKADRGQQIVHRLLADADVVVQNFAPGALDRQGLGIDQLHDRYPGLIACSITGYGEDGPYRDRKAYDLLLQGEAGLISISGTPEQQVKSALSVVDISAGMYAFSTILAALLQRKDTGEGAAIRISLFDSIMEWMTPLALQAAGGKPPARAGDRHASIVPYGPYRVADGKRVMLAIQNEREWARLCADVLRHPEWTLDPRFARNELRVANRRVLEPMIEDALVNVSVDEAEARLESAAIAYSRSNDIADALSHPQLTSRNRLQPVGTPVGEVSLPRSPFNLDGITERAASVPTIGQHTGDILTALGYTAAQIEEFRSGGVV